MLKYQTPFDFHTITSLKSAIWKVTRVALFDILQAKLSAKPNPFVEYDEYVPMVDKPVDASWKKEVSAQKAPVPKGETVWFWSFLFIFHLVDNLLCLAFVALSRLTQLDVFFDQFTSIPVAIGR